MVGIYKYECGLRFTGIIAETKEKAEEYLKKTEAKGLFDIQPLYTVQGDEEKFFKK